MEFNHEFNPNEYPEYPKVMQEIMESTASRFCKTLPIPAEPETNLFWVH